MAASPHPETGRSFHRDEHGLAVPVVAAGLDADQILARWQDVLVENPLDGDGGVIVDPYIFSFREREYADGRSIWF